MGKRLTLTTARWSGVPPGQEGRRIGRRRICYVIECKRREWHLQFLPIVKALAQAFTRCVAVAASGPRRTFNSTTPPELRPAGDLFWSKIRSVLPAAVLV